MKDFEDLTKEETNFWLEKAYNHFVENNLIPYGIFTGDDGIWDEMDDIWDYAQDMYEISIDGAE